ncbi:MAG: EAL domain-containing protein [Acidimicrobiales bacterium]
MSQLDRAVHEVRDQKERADLAIARSADGSPLTSVAMIGATIVASWGLSYLWGGSRTVGPQLFYAPIIIAATRFGHLGAFITAVVSGVVCGPLLPFNVQLDLAQSTGNWTLRLLVFVVIGQVVAALHLRSLPAVRERLDARQFRQRVLLALDADEIRPVYQPFVDLGSGRIVGVEALARWHTPDGQVERPAEFIPQAEAAGVITAIDLEILRQAASQVAAWRTTVLADFDEFVLSVNLSGRGFEDPDLAAHIEAVLDGPGLAPSSVVIEVTETALIADHERAATRMAELKAVGVRIALDDFGVGQSSLAALHRYPIDVIKLDRTFLALTGADRLGLLTAVVDLAGGLSTELVVAEGIETPAHLRGVVSAGCLFGQGFLFDQPLDAVAFGRALEAGGYHLPAAPIPPGAVAPPEL